MNYPTHDSELFYDVFLANLAKAEKEILDTISELTGGDVREVYRAQRLLGNIKLIDMLDTKYINAEALGECLEDGKTSRFYKPKRSSKEHFMSAAIDSYCICQDNIQAGELMQAFEFLANTNAYLGAVHGRNLAEEIDRIEKQAGGIRANKQRTENYQIIEDKLKQHWQGHIKPTKKATEAAILLERTDIYKNAMPQPKRGTLEKYIRVWQVVQK